MVVELPNKDHYKLGEIVRNFCFWNFSEILVFSEIQAIIVLAQNAGVHFSYNTTVYVRAN